MSVSATRSVTNTPRGIGPKTRDVTTLWLMRRARAREMSSGPMRLTATAPETSANHVNMRNRTSMSTAPSRDRACSQRRRQPAR